MKFISKKLKYVLVVVVLIFGIWIFAVYQGVNALGGAFEDLTATTSELQNSIEFQGSIYTLTMVNGGAFTSREWLVRKGNEIVLHMNSHDGFPEQFIVENGQLYLIGKNYRSLIE